MCLQVFLREEISILAAVATSLIHLHLPSQKMQTHSSNPPYLRRSRSARRRAKTAPLSEAPDASTSAAGSTDAPLAPPKWRKCVAHPGSLEGAELTPGGASW